MRELMASDVMTHLVLTLRADDTIEHAVRKLVTNRISGAPVVSSGELTGIVSESDLMRAYLPDRPKSLTFRSAHPLALLLSRSDAPARQDVRVGDVMTADVVTCTAECSVWECARLMESHNVRRLPVIDEDRFVVGILTRSDLIRAMASGEEETSAVRLVDQPSTSGLAS